MAVRVENSTSKEVGNQNLSKNGNYNRIFGYQIYPDPNPFVIPHNTIRILSRLVPFARTASVPTDKNDADLYYDDDEEEKIIRDEILTGHIEWGRNGRSSFVALEKIIEWVSCMCHSL